MANTDKLTHAYHQFISVFDQLDRAGCIAWAQKALMEQELSLLELYDRILVPSLNRIASNEVKQEIPIWEEHAKSAIVRSIIEMASPYVYQASRNEVPDDERLQAVILCLEEEYHELGARIAADYLILNGFTIQFIGANTPKREIFSALKTVTPALLVISVTNYYHLIHLQHLIEEIRADKTISVKIAVGGYAVDHTPDVAKHIQPDFFVKCFEDFAAIKEAMK